MELSGKTIVLYDGVCGLCNRSVRFLLRHDNRDRFRFAPLQSEFASSLLNKHGINAAELDSVSVVTDYGLASETAFTKSDSVLRATSELGGIWRAAEVGRFIPQVLRDWLYDRVARSRYRIFGEYKSCPAPSPQHRTKFIDF